MRVLDIKQVGEVLAQKKLAWQEADASYRLTADSFAVSNKTATQLFGKFWVLESQNTDEENFLNGQVQMARNGKFFNLKMDSDVVSIPELGSKGSFDQLLPYIEDGSIEVRFWETVNKRDGFSDKKPSIYWRWNPNTVASCPFKLMDAEAYRSAGRNYEGGGTFHSVELSLDDFAF